MGIDVVCALIFQKGKVWQGKRPAHKHMGGFFEFPGGKVKEGETEREALARELKEELGVDAHIGKRSGEIVYHYPDKTIRLIGFEVNINEAIQLKEHVDERWVGLNEESGSDWADADRELWKAYRNR